VCQYRSTKLPQNGPFLGVFLVCAVMWLSLQSEIQYPDGLRDPKEYKDISSYIIIVNSIRLDLLTEMTK
jgi:hypothetical protein